DGEIELRIEGELLARGSHSFSLSCLTYWSNRSSRASHSRRRAVSQSSTSLNRSGASSYVRTRPRFFDFTSRLCSSTERCCTNDRSEEHTSELQSRSDFVCRLLLEQKRKSFLLWTSPTDSPG